MRGTSPTKSRADCRHIVASFWYRQAFPTRLSPQRAAMPEFDTTVQGCRLATSVGGVLPEAAPRLAPYLAELTTFPNGKHDDQVDSTAQMLDWFKGTGRHSGIFGYYRMLAQMRDAPG